ncbi:hypothetical protein [Chitinophaga sp. YIM B06452]|uniref:hypothetical protein n=1 Tax=Chitinophaga sp. YIM B06452 TaxID=3082158 RepID=UPI0031FE7226
MEITTRRILKISLVLSWIIFIGLCIEAGASMFSAFYTLVINPANAATFLGKHDLSGLYKYGPDYFFAEALLISIVLIVKAFMFYLIVKILQEKKLDLSQPFSGELRVFMIKMSGLAFGTGLFSWCGVKYTEWLVKQGVKMPDTQGLHLGGADVWLFMSVTLFIVAQIFKRGVEIQTENDLTV